MNFTVLSALIAAFAAALSVTFSIISFFQARKSKKAAAYSQISSIYDRLISFRIEHPEVLSLSRKWDSNMMKVVYEQKNKKDKQWVTYYTFVELCIGYCNVVFNAWYGYLIDDDSFFTQYEPLARLLMTEHNPIIKDLSDEGIYISNYIKEYRKNLQGKDFWDWEGRYKDVTKITTNASLDNSLLLKIRAEMRKMRRKRKRFRRFFGDFR